MKFSTDSKLKKSKLKSSDSKEWGGTEEQGSMIVVVLSVVFAIVFLGALVLDLTRFEFTGRTIQRAVDSAAHAGTVELTIMTTSDLDRWTGAKRAALGALQVNPVFADFNFPDVANSGHRVGPNDACVDDAEYDVQIYDNGEVRIQIERGLYADTDGVFVSLEDDTNCKASNVPPPNAVRVTMRVEEVDTVFAGISPIGSAKMEDIERQGLARGNFACPAFGSWQDLTVKNTELQTQDCLSICNNNTAPTTDTCCKMFYWQTALGVISGGDFLMPARCVCLGATSSAVDEATFQAYPGVSFVAAGNLDAAMITCSNSGPSRGLRCTFSCDRTGDYCHCADLPPPTVCGDGYCNFLNSEPNCCPADCPNPPSDWADYALGPCV